MCEGATARKVVAVRDLHNCNDLPGALRQLRVLGLVVCEEDADPDIVCSTEFAIRVVKALFEGRMGGATPVWLEMRDGQLYVNAQSACRRNYLHITPPPALAGLRAADGNDVVFEVGNECFEVRDYVVRQARVSGARRGATAALDRDCLQGYVFPARLQPLRNDQREFPARGS